MAGRLVLQRKYGRMDILRNFGLDVDHNVYRTNLFPLSRLCERETFLMSDDLLLLGAVSRDNNKLKYWVENERDCIAVHARGLNIAHGNDEKCWTWETDSDGIEVAKLVKTQWLEVKGSILTRHLSPDLWYKVSFWLKTTSSSNIKKKMVDLHLNCPDGNQVTSAELPEGDEQWQELKVGRFKTGHKAGKMEFKMEKLFPDGGTGLIIKCVEIKPE